MSSTLIPLTQDHIDRGIAGAILACPVALALSEGYQGLRVAVGRTMTTVRFPPGIDRIFYHDEYLEAWILKFDTGDTVYPGTLLIDEYGPKPVITWY